MELVHPIRDRKKIKAMKKALLEGPQGCRNHLLFVLGINSGLRISDLLSLTFNDIINGNGVKSNIKMRENKTGKLKDFPLSKVCIDAINTYVTNNPYSALSDLLFPISRTRAWQIIKQAAINVGIEERIGTHSLRKTFGYHAFKAGADITRIQKLLNHSSPGITLAYIGITKDELDGIYLNLNL
jgi:integrase